MSDNKEQKLTREEWLALAREKDEVHRQPALGKGKRRINQSYSLNPDLISTISLTAKSLGKSASAYVEETMTYAVERDNK